MNIGVINKKYFEIKEGGEKKKKQYLEMSIRPPFMESATFTLTQNANKENEAAPDFIINYSYNRRNEKYRRVRVGAIWNDTSEGGLAYKRGHIESPVFPGGKMYFAIFEAKPFDGEDSASITWTHEVVWSPPKEKDENENSEKQAPPQHNYEENIDEDEIPF